MICIEKYLCEAHTIDGWKINSETVESYQLFFVHEKLETVRSTDTEAVTVTVYRNHDGKKGMASFKLYASTTENEARERIADAAEKALLISNAYYELPQDEQLDGVIPSNFTAYETRTLAAKMAEAVYTADMLGMGSVNALEIFINKIAVSVKNSCGIDKREKKYSAVLEAIPTWNEGESVELYEAVNVSSFDFDMLQSELSSKMREVRDRGYAKTPEKALKCPVLLHGTELVELFNTLASGLNYASVYTHSNPFSEGDDIQQGASGDRLSMTMRGKISGCVASALFDGDGSSLIDTEVIHDGKVVSYFGSHRFAQYLEKPVTGDLGCIEVAAGTLTENALQTAPYFECVSMSGLQVDIFNDYIGGEVRLAYYFDGEKKIPVSGISISGKLSDALSSVRLAEKTTGKENYYGPAYALFDGVEIV